MRIIAFGDIHMQHANSRLIAGLAEADRLILIGDLSNFGGRAEAGGVLAALAEINPRLLGVAGNLDRPEVEELLREQGYSLHGRGVALGQVGFFGVGGSNPTPFHTPNEFSEKELERLLAAGHAAVRHCRFRILVSHPPPHQNGTDLLSSGGHAGSTAVRAFIEKEQPDLCLCGHIHEARGKDTIGRTRIINPGMLQEGGWIEITVTGENLAAELHIAAQERLQHQCLKHMK
ncbi:metallophosphoesterase family protein [Thiovibrio sp. JS02]